MARHQFVALTVGAAFLSASLDASAYNWETHSTIVEKAVTIMQNDPIASTYPPPPEIPEAEWKGFLELVRAAPEKLSYLRTGLPTSLPRDDSGLAPPAGERRTDKYPFADEESAANCVIHPDDNLTIPNRFRIRDFRYKPERSASPCGLIRVDNTSPIPLRTVLGWHAANVDDHLDDTVLWFRPTNAFVWGLIKEVASRIYEYAAGALLVPFVCIARWFSGRSCNPADAFDLAREYNPIDYVEGWIPGVGDIRSDDYTGLWHFIHTDAGTRGRYNDVRGMFYEGAGPNFPGAIDIAIMAGADLSGLSLNAHMSRGNRQYGKYDRVARGLPAWQAHTIGHLEFSPVSNLALHGWNEFAKDDYESARGLAWPLHAIGDASAPHHVVGTTSHGHRPYEDFVERRWSAMMNKPGSAQDSAILRDAYRHWSQLSEHGDIRRLVIDLAFETRELVAVDHFEQVYNDLASVVYLTFKSAATDMYSGTEPLITPLLENAVGASMGFLVYVADRVNDPGFDPRVKCPPGAHYEPFKGCQPDPGKQPVFEPADVLMDDEADDAGAGDGGCAFETCDDDNGCGKFWLCVDGCCMPNPH